jgi:hypothetical protein
MSNNNLTTLDLSNNNQLSILNADNNQLVSLNIPKDSWWGLSAISVNYNNLTTLDISGARYNWQLGLSAIGNPLTEQAISTIMEFERIHFTYSKNGFVYLENKNQPPGAVHLTAELDIGTIQIEGFGSSNPHFNHHGNITLGSLGIVAHEEIKELRHATSDSFIVTIEGVEIDFYFYNGLETEIHGKKLVSLGFDFNVPIEFQSRHVTVQVVFIPMQPDPCLHSLPSTWQVITPATCGADGMERKRCTLDGCDYYETQVIPANPCNETSCEECNPPCLDHDWTIWSPTVIPTCTADGLEIRHCNLCNIPETKILPAIGHEMQAEWTITRDPTCTATGSQIKQCIHCVHQVTEVIPSDPCNEETCEPCNPVIVVPPEPDLIPCTPEDPCEVLTCTECNTLIQDQTPTLDPDPSRNFWQNWILWSIAGILGILGILFIVIGVKRRDKEDKKVTPR